MERLEFIFQSPVWMGILIIGLLVVVGIVLVRNPQNRAGTIKDYNIPGLQTDTPDDQPLSLADHLNRGNALLAQYNFDQALAHFQEALKLKTNDPAIHFKVGRIFLQKDDLRHAIAAFRNVLNLNPQQLDAHFELARIYQQLHDPAKAHQELNHALNIDPDHEEVLKLKVKLYEQAQQYDQALPWLRKLVRLSHQPLTYRTMLAEALTRLGQHEEAILEYTGLRDLDPDHAVLYHYKIGEIRFEQGHYDQAIEHFKHVLHHPDAILDEAQRLSARSQMAAALCNEGVSLFNAHQHDVAIERYQEALLYDDTNADIHYNLGKAYLRLKNSSEAMRHFGAALDLSPQDIGSCYELAVLQDEKGLVTEAVQSYQRVLELDPTNVTAMFGLGTLYGVQDEMDKAVEYLTQAIRIHPQFTDAFYNLGVALERKKDFNKAAQMYQKVLSLDPTHEKARSNLTHISHMKAQGNLH